MAVPKRRTSKSKIRTRRASHKVGLTRTVKCGNCGKQHLPHRVCPHCGFYNGKQVVSIEVKEKKKE
jgi:large subunit ribosomal protein L32